MIFSGNNFWSNSSILINSISEFMHFLKTSTSYALNSWIYTTNHKRISVNYFNFVLVAGTAGMSLATVIRSEFAYPGVGILAGDSLQYLSIATAHGVIMVFYMIMPLIFGAFGNFLLPTQLGVHDVAFPSLNSAAFWFLPGGLIMLMQLVCVDSSYQRMNCFNISELQGILKRSFFSDLVNSADHSEILSSSMIGLSFNTNNNLNLEHDTMSFFKLGTNNSANSSSTEYSNYYTDFLSSPNVGSAAFDMNLSSSAPHATYYTFSVATSALSSLLLSPFQSLTSMLSSSPLSSLSSLVKLNFSVSVLSSSASNAYEPATSASTTFYASNQQASSVESKYAFLESENLFSFSSFTNPVISYDYNCGNYIGIWDKLYPSLMTSFIEVASGISKAPWFASEQYGDLLSANYNNYLGKFTNNMNLKLQDSDNWYASHVAPVDSFFNFYYLTANSTNLNDISWSSLNSLEQNFHNMFATSSTQQRIIANWSQLKFSSEAWSCKLLAASHQNTLYRSFVGEEGYVWSIESNANDLLPGWAMVTPFSASTSFTAIGNTDIGLMGVFLAINASIVSSANFLVTYSYLSTLNNSNMSDASSFFSEGLITASWMMIAANPMLAIGILMLLSDSHWQTSFFDYSGGGDTVLFQHMFWFFGHPEVYIIMLPVFGFANTIMSYYFSNSVSASASLLYSMYTIAFLGFWVWGHHMYMVGLSHTTSMLFSTLTVMISVPAATNLMHWCVTIVNSIFVMEIPLIFTLTFAFFFVMGGISGMCVAHTGMDILFHDTFYVIGHFHVMFAGSAMLAIFSAFYFYFPAIYGVKYSSIFAYIHFTYYVLGQTLTVVPMMWLGYCGQPSSVLDYPYSLGGWHAIASAGHLLSVAALISFFFMIYDSISQANPTISNTFGAGSVNTSLSFYFFEINSLSFIQNNNLHHFSLFTSAYNTNNNADTLNLESLDTTLFSYSFFSTN